MFYYFSSLSCNLPVYLAPSRSLSDPPIFCKEWERYSNCFYLKSNALGIKYTKDVEEKFNTSILYLWLLELDYTINELDLVFGESSLTISQKSQVQQTIISFIYGTIKKDFLLIKNFSNAIEIDKIYFFI
jgi:hypothetical protein